MTARTRTKTCDECGDRKPLPFHSDPRDPPIEEGPCMCADCYEGALVEVIDYHKTAAQEYEDDLMKLKHPAPRKTPRR